MRISEKKKGQLSMSLFLLCIVYATFTVLALVLLRLGGGPEVSFIDSSFNVSLPVKVIIGLILYVLSFLIYLFIIPHLTFTRTFPILNGSLYTLIVFSGIIFFRERITVQHIVGSLVILAGVLILGYADNG